MLQITCLRGHHFTEKNTRWAGIRRICRRCERMRQKANKEGRSLPDMRREKRRPISPLWVEGKENV